MVRRATVRTPRPVRPACCAEASRSTPTTRPGLGSSLNRRPPTVADPDEAWVNPTMMRMLKERLGPARVETAEAVGWSVEALEAQAFAFLAVRSLEGLPLTYPGTTGSPRPLCGGVLASPRLGSASAVRGAA